jgi:hypothetical protein
MKKVVAIGWRVPEGRRFKRQEEKRRREGGMGYQKQVKDRRRNKRQEKGYRKGGRIE